MKKGLCLLLCFITIFAFSACDDTTKEPENSLLSDLQISRDAIDYVLVTNNQMQEIKITDQNDFAFLFDYVYKGEFPGDRLHELYLFPAARSLTICCGEDNNIKVTVLEDGSIVTGTGTTEPYKMYISDTLEKANAQALLVLLEKYGG